MNQDLKLTLKKKCSLVMSVQLPAITLTHEKRQREHTEHL